VDIKRKERRPRLSMYAFQFFFYLFFDGFIQMMISNDTDRFTIAIDAIKGGAKVNQTVSAYAHEKCSLLKHLRQKEKDYLYFHGKGAVASLGSKTMADCRLRS
jgi:hypothetical protein